MKLPVITIAWVLTFNLLFGQHNEVLQLHPLNPHYFLYQNKPAILIGSGEHYGSVINLDFDYRKYLQTIAKDGLNITRLFTGTHIENPGDSTGEWGIRKNTLAPLPGRVLLPWKRSNIPGYTLGGNKFDLTEWDEAYFARLKDFVMEARQNGVIVEVSLFSAYYVSCWNYSALNPKNNVNGTDSIASNAVNTLENGNILKHQERYVRKLVRELNGFGNFYFEVQNEPWADRPDTIIKRSEYIGADDWRATIQVVSVPSESWQREVTRWIKDEEKTLHNKHLISQNISDFYYPISNPDPYISIFNFHYTLPRAVTENYYLNKVIGFNETGFAGSSDITYRRQAWEFLMAGGGLFNHLDFSFSVGYEDGRDSAFVNPGGGSPALRKQLSFLKRYVERSDFIRLHPDVFIVQAAPGAMTKALSNGRAKWVIYYEPMSRKPNSLMLNLPIGHYRAEWMDVVTGIVIKNEVIKNGIFEVPEGGNDKVVTVSATLNKK